MNPEARAYLDKILEKSPNELTDIEIAFLKARSSYLKRAQLDEYAEVLTASKPKVEEKQDDTVSYDELLRQAKELGYQGPRMKRKQLEEYIKKGNQTSEAETVKQNATESH